MLNQLTIINYQLSMPTNLYFLLENLLLMKNQVYLIALLIDKFLHHCSKPTLA